MPYQWLPPEGDTQRLYLWPYRSLPRRGMVWFIGGTATLITLPLLVLLGSPILWGLLPFLLAAIGGIWWALERSFKDAEILETLSISASGVSLVRQGPKGRLQEWQANPHWVRLILHPTAGPVPNYLTLQGGPREVELGSFLAPGERLQLMGELRQRLTAMR